MSNNIDEYKLDEEDLEQIEEAQRVVRVTAKGEKIRRIKCRAGFRLEGNRCVPMTGSEKQTKRLAILRAVRTKRADIGGQKRAVRKRLRALSKRKAMGIV